LGVAIEFVSDEFAEFEDRLFFDLVEDLGAAFFAKEEFGVVKDAELFGDIGLGGIEGVDEFVDGFGAGFEFLKDGEAGGFGEGAEDEGDFFEGIAIHFPVEGSGRAGRNFFGSGA
jgi:hypothetical protein